MSHAHREFTGTLAAGKIGSPFCTTTLERQAGNLLLRKANKRSNQKKEPEAINRSISQVTEFISLVSELELFVEDVVGRVRNWNRK